MEYLPKGKFSGNTGRDMEHQRMLENCQKEILCNMHCALVPKIEFQNEQTEVSEYNYAIWHYQVNTGTFILVIYMLVNLSWTELVYCGIF